jgi:hypothetical protein
MLESSIENETMMLKIGTLHSDAKRSRFIERFALESWTDIIDATAATEPHPIIWKRLHQPCPRTALLASVTRMAKEMPRWAPNFDPTITAMMVTGITFGMKLRATREKVANPTNRSKGQNHDSEFFWGLISNHTATARNAVFNSPIAIGETVGPWVPMALNMIHRLSGEP